MRDVSFYMTIIRHECTHFKAKMFALSSSVCKWQPLGFKRSFQPTGPSDTRFVQFQIYIAKGYLELEPIGVLFIICFGTILIIQFVAMLFHRFGTLSHMLATTRFTWCQRAVQVRLLTASVSKNMYLKCYF
jgi:hypothetical protein